MKYFYLILLVLMSIALGMEIIEQAKDIENANFSWIGFFIIMVILWIIVLGARIND